MIMDDNMVASYFREIFWHSSGGRIQTHYILRNHNIYQSRDISVDTVTGYRVNGRGKSFLFHSIQTDSVAHPASYTTGTRGSFSRGKEAWA
jgi:hypothetical protein